MSNSGLWDDLLEHLGRKGKIELFCLESEHSVDRCHIEAILDQMAERDYVEKRSEGEYVAITGENSLFEKTDAPVCERSI